MNRFRTETFDHKQIVPVHQPILPFILHAFLTLIDEDIFVDVRVVGEDERVGGGRRMGGDAMKVGH